jgi:signal transduction histidine kinase
VFDVRWLGRVFHERDVFARLVLLDLSGLGYLLIHPAGGRPGVAQWTMAVLAFAGVLVLHRLPLVSALVQIALLGVGSVLLDDTTIHQVGASWTLLELTIAARRAAAIWAAVGLLGVVYGGHAIGGALAAGAGPPLQSAFGAVTVIGLPLLLGLLVRSSRDLARQAEERAAEQRRHREAQARMAVIRERAAIARELHDVVAHHVASMVLRVGVARHVLPDLDPRVAEVFDDLHGTGTAALADLRRLVALLRGPDGLGPDAATTAVEADALPQAIDAAVANARGAGLTVETDIADGLGGVDAVRGLAVLRLVQEALTNVAKHAGPAARARVTVAVRDGDVHVEVVDDGPPGGVPERPLDGLGGEGHGLTGMRERVDLFGGRFEAGPAGSGWRVAAVLPAVPTEGDDG